MALSGSLREREREREREKVADCARGSLRRSYPGDKSDGNNNLRRSWRRLGRAAALAAAWRSSAALPWQRFAFSARCVVLGGSRSLRLVVGAVASSLGVGRHRVALTVPLPAAPRWRSWRRLGRAAAPAAAWRSAAALPRRRLALLARRRALSACVIGAVASSPLAVAVARLSRRRYLRRSVRSPCAGVVVPPHSRQRHARPPLLRGGGSRPWHGTAQSAAYALCTQLSVRSRPLWRGSPSRGSHGAATCDTTFVDLAPASPCRRTHGGVTLGRRRPRWRLSPLASTDVISGARSLRVAVGAVASSLGGSPSRGSHGATACGAALAILAPASSCRRTHGGVALSRRRSAVAALSLGAVRSDRRLTLSACSRRHGRFLIGGGRRRAALAAPLPAVPHWRPWRRLGSAAALAAAWRSAAALLRRRLERVM